MFAFGLTHLQPPVIQPSLNGRVPEAISGGPAVSASLIAITIILPCPAGRWQPPRRYAAPCPTSPADIGQPWNAAVDPPRPPAVAGMSS
jgi:hypothetical protein